MALAHRLENHENNAATLFHEKYSLQFADTEALKQEVFRVRYQVYCNEIKTEDPSEFPDQMEHDAHDEHAVHFLLIDRQTNNAIGCIRMIQSEHRMHELPFEKLVKGNLYPEFAQQLDNMQEVIEVSRAAVIEPFRKHQTYGQADNATRFAMTMGPVSLFLSTLAYSECKQISCGYAMMQPRLARRLQFVGLPFVQIGNPVEYHGLRAPYIIFREAAVESVSRQCEGIYQEILKDISSQLNAKSSETSA